MANRQQTNVGNLGDRILLILAKSTAIAEIFVANVFLLGFKETRVAITAHFENGGSCGNRCDHGHEAD